MSKKIENITMKYGRNKIEFQIPKHNLLALLEPNKIDGVVDEDKEIEFAIQNPYGTLPLTEIIRSKNKNAVIVINDITRPTPSYKIIPHFLKILNTGGVKDCHISILVANGGHRANTQEELKRLLSSEILNRVSVINHDYLNDNEIIYIGKTSGNIPIEINKLYYHAGIKILTGTIAPHQAAGYGGGRKSIIPGIASHKTLSFHHSHHFRLPGPSMGIIQNNPFHYQSLEGAKVAGVDFILNVVQNTNKNIVKAVAGDLEKAWEEGVKWARQIHEVKSPNSNPDVVIASPGGFPKDINLYQIVKTVTRAEAIVKEGGTIIIPAECSEGYGIAAGEFVNWLTTASDINEVIDRFKKEGYHEGSNAAFLYARALKKAEIIIVTHNIPAPDLNRLFLNSSCTMEEALEKIFSKYGKDCKIIVMKDANDIVPI